MMAQPTSSDAQASVAVTSLSLPKSSGTLTGTSAGFGAVGPDGASTMTLPLPISPGRGFAPALALGYRSGGGSGVFGLGWSLGVPVVRRRTDQARPRYTEADEFVGPDGEVLVPERDASGAVVTTSTQAWLGSRLPRIYAVVRYVPRVEGAFHRLECWTAGPGEVVWLRQDHDGTVHRYGVSPAGRLADPADPAHIAEWRLEDSLSPLGERIVYRYAAEDGAGVDASPRDVRAARHLVAVHYGNVVPLSRETLWHDKAHDDADWLFSLVFDYGERGRKIDTLPPYGPTGVWDLRQDALSRYDYGFEHRLWRLCRQVLMYHRFPDREELAEPVTLVGRLLLEYDESPVLTHLAAAHHVAYERGPDHRAVAVPPLELEYNGFDLKAPVWHQMETVSSLTDMRRCHWVDLYGEGLAGLLYRAGPEWRYREPVRDAASADPDAVTYGPWQILPQVPALHDGPVRLVDIDGDGQLEWVVTQPGLAGYFTVDAERRWSTFIPLDALPVEFFQDRAQLVDLCGGRPDLALIGPRSVRLYANQGQGFATGVTVAQDDAIVLPVAGLDATELVAFSDVLGSGHADLVRVRHDAVTCWPHLGYGRFGAPVKLGGLAFDATGFNPAQVLLADIDGTGTADLIYWQHDRLLIHRNQSGNGFAAAVTVSLPEGLRLSRLSDLQAADIDGKGIASLVIDTGGAAPQHWRLRFTAARPHLLARTANNMGAGSTVVYRSSAQYWLDEKQADSRAVCRLPYPMQVVSRSMQADELTGNVLTQSYRYARGSYDRGEREFRGFGYVETVDTTGQARGSAGDSPAEPLLSRHWYHTGDAADETGLAGCWDGDDEALVLGGTRFAGGMADAAARLWGYRALKGHPLRQETFALTDPSAPYHVMQWRYQVVGLQPGQAGGTPVVLPLALEDAHSRYERIAGDPSVSHHVTLAWDRYGTPIHAVAVTYPRRPRPAANPYPPTLPDAAWDGSYDPQQQNLLLVETRQQVIHLDGDPQQWRLGLSDRHRQNVLTYAGRGWLSAERLADPTEGLLGPQALRRPAGQGQVVYTTDPPTLQALVSHTLVAAFDASALQAYEGVALVGRLTDLLTDGGYVSRPTLLPVPDAAEEAPAWYVERGLTTYAGPDTFYRPLTQRSTALVGAVTLGYDRYGFGPVTITDSLGQVTRAVLDYRHLVPVRLVDINGNTQEVRLDALGRVVCASHFGTEEGREVGFQALAEVPPTNLPQTVETALDWHERLPVAVVTIGDPFSWMGRLTEEDANGLEVGDGAEAHAGPGWAAMLAEGAITPDGYVRSRRTATPLGRALQSWRARQARLPPHAVSLTADRYPDDADQQVRMAVAYSDGFGRALQVAGRVAPGPAWRRNAAGGLETGADGAPLEAAADPRWAVSGRVEYDAKGQVVRVYRPYFVNDWQYVSDAAARTDAYADTHVFDALGRVCRVVTAAGALRRSGSFPWFTVSEDENDTWWETGAVVQDLSPDTAAAPADGTTAVTLTATVTDGQARPLAGLGVAWGVQGSGRLNATVTLTDADGKARVGLVGVRAGEATVTARVGLMRVETAAGVVFSAPSEGAR